MNKKTVLTITVDKQNMTFGGDLQVPAGTSMFDIAAALNTVLRSVGEYCNELSTEVQTMIGDKEMRLFRDIVAGKRKCTCDDHLNCEHTARPMQEAIAQRKTIGLTWN